MTGTTGIGARLTGLPADRREELGLRSREAARTVAGEPVAIVGTACRMPGGVNGPADYWRSLVDGEDAVREIPADRWDAGAFYDADPHAPGRMNSRWGSFLDDVAGFDAEFFKISPREATSMDPQQRILLEVVWEALENAGVDPAGLTGTRTGVFAGIYHSDYRNLTAQELDAYSSTGTAHSVAVGRVSYLLGLRGPSVAVDTACSASLVSAHLACQSLRLRESDLALAGGVNVILDPETQVAMSQWGMLAPDGRCKSFDGAADGFVRGEGCGVVVLKRLIDAVRDGDPVIAVIRGSAVNSDGRSQGVTAPSGVAQREVLRTALDLSGVAPRTIGYVEAHGTGTALGDPIEFESLEGVYGTGGPEPRCALGTVKTNLGHLEAAAGVAGLIKAALAVRAGIVPPNLHFQSWNPAIEAEGSRFFVPVAATPWPQDEGPRRAAVSSFGFGGTNAHLVLEEYLRQAAPPEPAGPVVYPVAATSPERVRDTAAGLAAWLDGPGRDVPAADLGLTLARRSGRKARAAVVADSRERLAERLAALAAGDAAPGTATGTPVEGNPGTVWVFPGQGSQWPAMGRELMACEKVFADTVAALDPLIEAEAGFSPAALLRAGREEDLRGIEVIQPTLFTMQLALAETWRSYGVEPAAVIGQSVGEVAAAVVAGAISRADGAAVVCRRSRLLAEVAGQGLMAMVEAPADKVRAVLSDVPEPGAPEIAVLAGPALTVVSGEAAGVRLLVERLAALDIDAHEIKVDVASHSAAMDPLTGALRDTLGDLAPGRPDVPFYTTVLGDPSEMPPFDAGYWVANLRRPVRFADAVRAAAGDGHRRFLEISPHPVLGGPLADTLLDRLGDGFTITASLRRDEPARERLLTGLAELYTAGHPLDWDRQFPGGTLTDLPPTPWRHQRYWAETTTPGAAPAASAPDWLLRPTWEPAPEPAVPEHLTGGWLVVPAGDRDETAAAELAAELAARGAAARATRTPSSFDDLRGVVFLATSPDTHDDPRAAERYAADVLGPLRELAALPEPPRVWLVTRGAQAVGGETRLRPAYAPLWGLGRWLAAQHPDAFGGLVDLAPDPEPGETRRLLAELGTEPGDEQAAHRDGARYVPRLRRAETSQAEATPIPADGACLVVGGTGRTAPALLPGLVRLGARHLVVTSRRGPSGAADETVAKLRAEGVTVTEIRADVADEAAMERLFQRFGGDLPPLRAVVHAALTEGTARLEDMDERHLAAMFGSKVTGTALLGRLCEAHDVACFVGFSALAALFGGWDPAYAAANCYLETYVHERRLRGLPGHVVNWGAWREGIEGTAQQHLFEGTGLRLMPGEQAVGALARILPGRDAQTVVADADWSALGRADSAAPSPLLTGLAGPAADEPGQPDLAEEPPFDGSRESLRRHVRIIVAGVLQLPEPEALGLDQNVFDVGMDSLMSVLIHRRLRAVLGRPIPPLRLARRPTVELLTEHLHGLLNP